jgi:diguanylate cyclase
MIRCILVDLAILVSCLYASFLVFRLNKKCRRFSKRYPRVFQGLFGLFCGVSGVLLALFPLTVNGTTFDVGCIFLLFAGIYGGTVPLAFCSSALILWTACTHGFSAGTALGIVSILLMAAIVILAERIKLSDCKKWFLCTVCFLPASLLGFLPAENSFRTFTYFALCFLLFSALCYCIANTQQKTDVLLQRLRRESTRDYLTGLNNVRRFDEMFNLAVRNSRKLNHNLSLLMCDIDFFKKINDQYGHQNGDAILVQFSRILQRDFPHCVLSRNGGEEFTVILRNCDEMQALAAAEQFRKNIERSHFALVDGGFIHITVSIGVASCCPGEGDERLLERADMALYTAKRGGRNKVSIFRCGNHSPEL